MIPEFQERLDLLLSQLDELAPEIDEYDSRSTGRFRSLSLRAAKFVSELGYPQWKADSKQFETVYSTENIESDEFAHVQSTLISIKDYFAYEQFDPNFISRAPEAPRRISTRKIFIVHGHDTELTTQTARFLEKLNLEPIILHEQPNQGQTIIEKFESYSDVGFAVVLLTPDDVGSAKQAQEKLKSRARQNVILELGYFLGKLGRKNVASIYKSGVEIPSDYQGVLFVPYDGEGMWKLKLTTELKGAGMKVNMNDLLD